VSRDREFQHSNRTRIGNEFDRQRSEAVIAEKIVAEANNGDSARRAPCSCVSETCAHKTFTRAITWPLASRV
jgi:hypothetical protein